MGLDPVSSWLTMWMVNWVLVVVILDAVQTAYKCF